MSTETNNLPTIYVKQDMMLPDNSQWKFRFEVYSETSDNVYIVSQNKAKRYWGCSCMAWRRWRECKHLIALGMPGKEKPHEMNIISQ